MAKTTTPPRITELVRRFVAGIVPACEPVYVRVQPDPGADEKECFVNVDRKVQALGGKILHGWIIWEWPGVHLEAVFHAIWRTPEGELLDVTPYPDGERRILFLPDPKRSYDLEHGGIVASILAPLSDEPVVLEYLALSRELQAFRADHTEHGLLHIPVELGPTLAALETRRQALKHTLILRATGRNDPCPCGSGRKFKRCHLSAAGVS